MLTPISFSCPFVFQDLSRLQLLNNLKKARGQVLGEDGVRVHSLVLPGLPSSTAVHFSGPGEVRPFILSRKSTHIIHDFISFRVPPTLFWEISLTFSSLILHVNQSLCRMQIYTIKHDITDVQCLMPGLIMAIRKVVRLKVIIFLTLRTFNLFISFNPPFPFKLLHRYYVTFSFFSFFFLQNLIYGLEKFL